MMSHPLKPISETEITYWRSRVASLELLVCELLAKNQDMRFVLGLTTREHPLSSVSAQRLGN